MTTNALAFKDWAASENIAQSAPIEQLKNTRIAIDADDFLRTLLAAKSHEPLLPALGGLPFSLWKRVDDTLQNFRDHDIDVVFIFNGLTLACRDRSSILRESRKAVSRLESAWSVYDQGKGEDAVTEFGKSCAYGSYHISRSFLAHLHEKGVFTLTAPYSAAAQMAYMLKDNFVHAVMGSASCLVFDAEKVITDVEWDSNPRFTWVAIDRCLDKLMLSRAQFVDLCLLSGSAILPALPDVDSEPLAAKMSATKLLLNRAGNDGHNVCLQAKDESYQSLFHKARFAIRHPIVLTGDGKIEPLNWTQAPSDVHEFIGQRLPEELYYYLSRGLVGPRVLNWRTRAEILEIPPLDGGGPQAYRDLVQTKLRPIRAQALALMTHSLNRYYQKKDVDLVCWWKDNGTALNVPDVPSPTQAADSWHIKTNDLPAPVETESSPFGYALCSVSDELAASTVVSKGSGAVFSEATELRSNILWRFLQDRGYFTANHTLTPWGKAFKAALREVSSSQSSASRLEMEEAVFLVLELLRLDMLNTKVMFNAYTGQPLRGSEKDKANTLLISRVACLGTFQHAQIGYTGPLSRNLLAYQQMVATTRSALRDLLEMHACNIFLSGSVDRTVDKNLYTDIGTRLPLLHEPDAGLGLIVKSYLDELSSEKRPDIGKWFTHALDINADLKKAWALWGAVQAGIRAAEGDIISADTKKMFESADQWLSQKRTQAETLNGSA